MKEHSLDSIGFNPRLSFAMDAPVDSRMLSEKTLEPLYLPLARRQFLESLRAGQLSEAFLNLTLLAGADHLALQDPDFALLAFANALSSSSSEMGCEFLMDQGFSLAPHQDTLLDYFLLSSLDINAPAHHQPMSWLMGQGARVLPERKLCWRSLQLHYPQLFSQNQAGVERRALDELLSPDVAEVRESPRL